MNFLLRLFFLAMQAKKWFTWLPVSILVTKTFTLFFLLALVVHEAMLFKV
jgi:hypothetical protein